MGRGLCHNRNGEISTYPFGVLPVTSNSYNVRNVNTDGTLNNNNAYNGNRGARPLWWIPRPSKRKPKAEDHHQRRGYPAAAW